MKRRFTKILAALALLACLTIPLGMWGQTISIDFEGNSIPSGWTNTNEMAVVSNPVQTEATGSYCLSTNGKASNSLTSGLIENVVSISVDATRTTNNTTNEVYIDFCPNDSFDASDTQSQSVTVNKNSWTTSTLTLSSTASGYVRIRRSGGSSTATKYIDNIVITTGGSTPTTYNVTVNQTTGGTIAVTPTQAAAGTTITLTATPAEGYSFGSWSITPNTVVINNNQFTMPDSDVTVSASWTQNSGGGATSPATLTQSNLGLTGAYTTDTEKTIDGITYVYTDLMKNNDNIQAKASTGTIKNTTAYPGDITSVVITHSGTARATTVNGSADGENWTQVATGSGSITADFSGKGYKYFQITRGSNAAYWTKIEIAWADANAPGISASDVDIAYDATSGSIAYTINNGVEGGAVTSAEVTASNPENWLTVNGSNPYTSPISLSCAANTTATEKTATVTLTYTYNRETVTETVNVTQAADPNATMTIAEVRALSTGTTVATKGVVTSISVSGSNKTAYFQDNTAGIVAYGPFDTTVDVGDEIRVEGELTSYNGLLEIGKSNAAPTVTVLSQNNTVTPVVKTIAEISNDIQAQLVKVEDVTVTSIDGQNTTIAQGENTIVVRGISGVEYAVNDVLTFTANVGCYNNNPQLVNPQNVEVHAVPSITIESDEFELTANEEEGYLEITSDNLPEEYSLDIVFCDANGNELSGDGPDWIDLAIEAPTNETGEFVHYLTEANDGAARTAYFKVYASWLVEVDGDVDIEGVYSNLVTINQAAPVITYLVNFSLDGGTFIPNNVFTESIVEIEAGTYALPSATKDGFTFAGWYDGINTYQAGSDYSVSDNIDFTAQWVVSFNVTYDFSSANNFYTEAGGDEHPATGNTNNVNEFYYGNGDKFTASGTSHYFGETNAPYFLFGKSGALLNLPIFANTYKITKITLHSSSSGSQSVQVAIVSGENIVADAQTWVNRDADYIYTIPAEYQESVLSVKVVSSHNAQITAITLEREAIEPATESLQKTLIADRWYIIASPFAGTVTTNAMDASNLYFYDEQDHFWRSKTLHENDFDFASGTGYLCGNKNDNFVLTFEGTVSEDDIMEIPLTYHATTTANEDNPLAGWNLVGNPFATTAAISNDYYIINEDGDGLIVGESNVVDAMQGVFVQATPEDQTVIFEKAEVGVGGGDDKLVVNLSQNRSNVIDRAIVRMGEGRQLPKFQLFEGNTKLYIPQDGQDYAVVRSEGQGELPVNFRASENGTYTLSMDVENMDMNYLHLIDNMTGMDVDLLQTPSYTFEAKVNDYESRFRLVFAANNEDGVSTSSTAFAFYSNGSWIINNAGEATLQVVDLTGRILSSETVNGSVSKTINAVPGVYMLRLINGDNVNVQKIVVR